MAKKKTDGPEGPPQTTQEAPPPEPGTDNPAVSAPSGNGEKKKPVASWKYPAAAAVTVEVALWPHTITLQDGSTIEVYNATIARNYKDQGGTWCKGCSFRIGEIPVLIHALIRAHGFALDAREMNCPL